MTYDPNQPRDPGGEDGGRWIKSGAAGEPSLPRRKWTPPKLGPDGKYHVYHGTILERSAKIKSTALKPPDGTGPGYLMLTSSKAQAARYAEGYAGRRVVLHYALTPNDANRWLTRPEQHDVYGSKAFAHGLRAGQLPKKFLVSVETAVVERSSGARVYG